MERIHLRLTAVLEAVLIVFVALVPLAPCDEPNIGSFRLPSGWDEITLEEMTGSPKGWKVRMLLNPLNGDTLLVAKSDQPHPRSFDDVVEFAPSGYPYWFAKQNDGFTINRVKTEKTTEFSLNGKRLESIAYTVVNDHESDDSTLMGQGFLVLTDSSAIYVQHSSRKPIAHWLARGVVETLLKSVQSKSKTK